MNSLRDEIQEKVVAGKLGSPWVLMVVELRMTDSIDRSRADRLDAQDRPTRCDSLYVHVLDRGYAVRYGPIGYKEVQAAGERVAIMVRRSVKRGRPSDERDE